MIVRVSREQIQELTRHAKSSPRGGTASESGPFNLRNRNPIYSNRFGRHFEVTPDRNPQLQHLDIFLSCVEINEVIKQAFYSLITSYRKEYNLIKT